MISQTRVWSPKYIKNLHYSNSGRQTIQFKKWAKDVNGHFSKEDIQRAQRHMKVCLASLAIRQMQIETIMICHFTLIRMVIITKSRNKEHYWGCGEKETLVHSWWECRLVQPLWKTVWNFLKKLKTELPFDPAIPPLRLYPKNPETQIQKNLCTPNFIAAQFTIAKCRKQPRCPSINDWIKKTVVHLHNRILWSRKKEGAPTLHKSMDGTGEHYAKWN